MAKAPVVIDIITNPRIPNDTGVGQPTLKIEPAIKSFLREKKIIDQLSAISQTPVAIYEKEKSNFQNASAQSANGLPTMKSSALPDENFMASLGNQNISTNNYVQKGLGNVNVFKPSNPIPQLLDDFPDAMDNTTYFDTIVGIIEIFDNYVKSFTATTKKDRLDYYSKAKVETLLLSTGAVGGILLSAASHLVLPMDRMVFTGSTFGKFIYDNYGVDWAYYYSDVMDGTQAIKDSKKSLDYKTVDFQTSVEDRHNVKAMVNEKNVLIDKMNDPNVPREAKEIMESRIKTIDFNVLSSFYPEDPFYGSLKNAVDSISGELIIDPYYVYDQAIYKKEIASKKFKDQIEENLLSYNTYNPVENIKTLNEENATILSDYNKQKDELERLKGIQERYIPIHQKLAPQVDEINNYRRANPNLGTMGAQKLTDDVKYQEMQDRLKIYCAEANDLYYDYTGQKTNFYDRVPEFFKFGTDLSNKIAYLDSIEEPDLRTNMGQIAVNEEAVNATYNAMKLYSENNNGWENPLEKKKIEKQKELEEVTEYYDRFISLMDYPHLKKQRGMRNLYSDFKNKKIYYLSDSNISDFGEELLRKKTDLEYEIKTLNDTRNNIVSEIFQYKKSEAEQKAGLDKSIEEEIQNFGSFTPEKKKIIATTLIDIKKIQDNILGLDDKDKMNYDFLLDKIVSCSTTQELEEYSILDNVNSNKMKMQYAFTDGDIDKTAEMFLFKKFEAEQRAGLERSIEEEIQDFKNLTPEKKENVITTLMNIKRIQDNILGLNDKHKINYIFLLDKIASNSTIEELDKYSILDNVYSNKMERQYAYTKGNTQIYPEKYATGGFIDRAQLAIIGEAGPEMVIPLSESHRDRGLALWQQAGEKMGVFSSGEAFSPSHSYLPSSDNLQYESDDSIGIQIGSLGGMNITIQGGQLSDPESIISTLHDQMPEIADELCYTIASMLQKVFINMPVVNH